MYKGPGREGWRKKVRRKKKEMSNTVGGKGRRRESLKEIREEMEEKKITNERS